jgi:hypothetical protein
VFGARREATHVFKARELLKNELLKNELLTNEPFITELFITETGIKLLKNATNMYSYGQSYSYCVKNSRIAWPMAMRFAGLHRKDFAHAF